MPPKRSTTASAPAANPTAAAAATTTKKSASKKATSTKSASTMSKATAANKRKAADDSAEEPSDASQGPNTKKQKTVKPTASTTSKTAATKKGGAAKQTTKTSATNAGPTKSSAKTVTKATSTKNGNSSGATTTINSDNATKTVLELKDVLRSRSLPLTGTKADLITRLDASDRAQETTSMAAAGLSKKTFTKSTTAPKVNGTASAAPAKASSTKRKHDDDEISTATKAKAEKKPRIVKPKEVINHAPTQRLHVYVFGEGSSAELGLGTAKTATDVKRPRLNPFLPADTVGVVQVATGGMHCAALTHDNKILTWGVNDQGALGRDTQWEGGMKDMDDEDDGDSSDNGSDSGLNPLEAVPTAVDMSAFPEGTVITQLAASDSATFALTDDGEVYGWGTFRGNEGVLGFTPDVHIQGYPLLIRHRGLKQVKQIACGDNHILALTNKGDTFSWGSGQQNQLGRRMVERTRLNGLSPSTFGLKKNITSISCGAFHSFAIDKTGTVFAWGLNSFGETGIPEGAGEDGGVVLHPTPIEALRQHGDVVCLDGGAHHSVAVTNAGKCLVWGRIDGYQTGLQIDTIPDTSTIKDNKGTPRILTVPTHVPGFNATWAAAGSDHTIAITKAGKAYSWGFSANYQTGQGAMEDVEVATLIDNTAVREKKLNWAGAGGQYSVLTAPADVEMNGT